MDKISPYPRPGANRSWKQASCSSFESKSMSRQAVHDAVRRIQTEILRNDQLSVAFGNDAPPSPPPLSNHKKENAEEVKYPKRAAQLLSLDVSLSLALFIHERLAVSQSEILDSPCSPLPLLALALVYQ